MNSQTVHPYYLARRPLIMADFLESIVLARPDFERLLPGYSLDDMMPTVLAEFDRVLEALPYVGGAEGRMTPFFEQNTGIIAIGRVLRARGFPVAVISLVMRKIYLAKLSSLPEAERFELGRQWLSRESQAYLRTEALASTGRENPGDFVYEYVGPGRTEAGEPFQFGLDYRECGFCKLFKAGGDEDLLPAVCAMDREVYALRGVELLRSTTLAAGDSHCNFRFRAARADHKE